MIGTCARREMRRNSDAQAGDALILTKPIGVGVYSAAIKREALGAGRLCGDARDDDAAQQRRRRSRARARRACDDGRDGLRPARARARDGARLEAAARARTPTRSRCSRARRISRSSGFVTGASQRNWASYGAEVELPAGLPRLAAAPAHRSADVRRPARGRGRRARRRPCCGRSATPAIRPRA